MTVPLDGLPAWLRAVISIAGTLASFFAVVMITCWALGPEEGEDGKGEKGGRR